MPKKKREMLRVPLDEAISKVQVVDRNADQGVRGYLGASMIGGECERAVWYKFVGAAPSRIPARIHRKFDGGHDKEARVVQWLREAGYEVMDKNPRARSEHGQYGAYIWGGIFGGHTDGFVRGSDRHEILDLGESWHLLECKDMTSARYWYEEDDTNYEHPMGNRHPTEHPTKYGNPADVTGAWWKMHRDGVHHQNQAYYSQLQAYMGLTRETHPSNGKPIWEHWGLDGPVNRALFVAVNTDTEQIHAELVEFKSKWWRAIKARALRIIRADKPPERIRETALYPPCSFCDYRGICHGGRPMEKSCKTCKHSTIKLPGDGNFFGSQHAWLCTYHEEGCGDFAACDAYEPIVDPLEF